VAAVRSAYPTFTGTKLAAKGPVTSQIAPHQSVGHRSENFAEINRRDTRLCQT